MSSKLIIPLVKPILPYVPLLPTPVLSLVPSLLLHYTTHPSPTSTSFIAASTTNPLHAPLIFTILSIPIIYTLGLISGNVSWVDRLWPFYTPLCTGLLVLWIFVNGEGGVYGHDIPRVALMWGLQLLWSLRLLSHALKRDFYNLKSEDYRYTVFRSLVPRFVFSLVHVFVIAIAQPLLLFSLSLPVYAIMSLPPSELASTTNYGISFGQISHILPLRYQNSAPASTTVLNLADLAVAFLAIGCLIMEYKTDREMYKFQSEKHRLLNTLPKDKLVHPPSINSKNRLGPRPSSYPPSHHPGFPTRGVYRYSRHANFASEQIFWVTQALFVVAGSDSSGVTRRGWGDGCVWAPCFALSILFCASTFLTEWITSRKFPVYSSYRRLVGQFLPQETFWIWLIGSIVGFRKKHRERVYGPALTRRTEKKRQ
ncbi:hypothetical protein I302_107986 [Kwoniella bestiolae CBS 10118]|uniref:Uncharacterized protein n=1 Tax=Kwoniella bestiolae CBS 10118 TaxID=1296100 RepID=A0A1B9FWZ3_9TREE|nr:hypothetical protein I302_07649 [Kwoniella bestiolae CBS 10118]OCF23295.1 hypothetical protein I302_07649 [Kwoniella bestiolae CBS 10118]